MCIRDSLGAEVVICYKERKKANVVEEMFLIGDVKDRNVILIDDMIDTAGTLCKAADILMAKRSEISSCNGDSRRSFWKSLRQY